MPACLWILRNPSFTVDAECCKDFSLGALCCLQGAARRRHLVLAIAFRGWREETQLQLYRRHVVVLLSHKVNNGTLLKAFNCWR